jgi:hypothetical protein
MILIATPSFDGTVVMDYAKSLAAEVHHLINAGQEVLFADVRGCAYVDKARDTLIHQFLYKTPADYLMFIDADIGWNPGDICRLIERDKNFIAGMYSTKETPCAFRCDLTGETDGDLLQANGVPGGFVLIKREAMQQLVDAHPELMYHDPQVGEKICAITHQYIKDATYVREDIALCRRWSEVGDGVWIDPEVKLRHWDGRTCYSTPFKEFLGQKNG